jgi:diguanylate cyclase (GGDEF)-like protein
VLEDGKLSAVLSDFARTMITDFPIQSILDGLVENIVDVLPISSAGVTLISPGSAPRYIAASDDFALAYEKLQAQFEEGPCTLAYERGEPVAIPDLRADDRFPRFGPAALAAGCAAVFTFPLRHGDGRLGALDLYRDTPGRLDQADLAAAQTLADVTAGYLLNAAAREEARVTSDRFRLNALHDALTGLPNRVLLEQRLEHAAQRARRSHTHSAVLYADLDRFKRINDTYGHSVGDELLIGVADRLAGLIRAGDTLARVSGDEFVFLCEDIRTESSIEHLAGRICAAFDLPFETSAGNLTIAVSVGIAFAGPGEAISNQLVVHADTAMYQAKRKGGASHQIVDLREANKAVDDRRLADAFRAAFSHEKLDLAYQPIVRTADESISGVETLLRWTDPERGPIPTMSMVYIAEQNGLIDEIGAWVLERACRDHARWLRDHPGARLELAVNISAVQLMSPGFCATVGRILADTGLDPSRLILEMTETIYVVDAERAMMVLADLRSMGVRLALNDFGTGFSSLSYLRKSPVDIIKIDRTFTANLGEDRDASALVGSLIALAHVLGLSVTVEGVETRAQRDAVRAMGSESAQGYFYARPMSADAINDLLTRVDLGDLAIGQ